MAASFTQAIAQFATLREFARMHTVAHTQPRNNYAQIIRDLFPKARTEPHKKKTSRMLFEIAWSFLSCPMSDVFQRLWQLDDRLHRIGDLPAHIILDLSAWHMHGKLHRRIRDLKTGRVLPAIVSRDAIAWHKHGPWHRADRDVRTGLTLPARIETEGFAWMRNGLPDRDDVDLASGLTLPAIIRDNQLEWYKTGIMRRINKKTGCILPASILCNAKNWKKIMFFMV